MQLNVDVLSLPTVTGSLSDLCIRSVFSHAISSKDFHCLLEVVRKKNTACMKTPIIK